MGDNVETDHFSYMEKRKVALAVFVVMPRGSDVRNRLFYFSDLSAVKAS